MPEKKPAKWSKKVEFLILVVVAVLVATVVRTYLVQTFYIPSASMEQTLLEDDKILVNKGVYRLRDPHRGEIVVFRPPAGWGDGPSHQDYIKRVIGVAGDRVVCCDTRKRVLVNGTPIDEDYLYPGDEPSAEDFDVTVPAGRLFVLGDHRSDSADSRAHLAADAGTVPVDRVVGRAFAVYWPVSRWRTLPVPGSGS